MKVLLCSDNFRLAKNEGKYQIDTSLYAYSLGIDLSLNEENGNFKVELNVGAKRTVLKVKELSNYIDTLTEARKFISDCNSYLEAKVLNEK